MSSSIQWKELSKVYLTHIQRHFKRFLLDVLRVGPIPQHVAFIMDGNRRYAKAKNISIAQAYLSGAETLNQTLDTCFLSGVKCITVYAFSTENFKRPPEQLETLMAIAVAIMNMQVLKLAELGHRPKVQVLGRLDLLPGKVRYCLQRVVKETSNNTETVLNLCVGYTSREEITTAIRRTVHETTDPGSITEHSLEQNLYTAGCPPLDIVVRTSGEKRLSDFLLWQCHQQSEIVVVDCNWPELGFLQLFRVFMGWQRRRGWASIASSSGVDKKTLAIPVCVLIAGLLLLALVKAT
ncbi:putative undecaprenyl diphosphate synthase-domain-containing protein [Aspergillus karnatakaensis]|uniref:undecaprenyl diphosphate synthase family protein n=1 Tax=Aspergillus karnatakaensis TaxID=1810916 RepID=UPI003CCCECD9